MPMPRARGWAPIAVLLLAGLTGALLGIGRSPHPVRGGKTRSPAFDPGYHLAGVHVPAPMRLRRRAVLIGLALVLLAAAGVYGGYEIKFARDARLRAVALTGGDPDAGRRLAQRYGCAGCHTIPGVPQAQGQVGPTLKGFAARVYIGGVVANSPDALIQWIENPKSIDPRTAMPVTGISQAEARDVAAYLYTLR